MLAAKERLITPQMAKRALKSLIVLYQKLNTDVMVILYIVYIIFLLMQRKYGYFYSIYSLIFVMIL